MMINLLCHILLPGNYRSSGVICSIISFTFICVRSPALNVLLQGCWLNAIFISAITVSPSNQVLLARPLCLLLYWDGV